MLPFHSAILMRSVRTCMCVYDALITKQLGEGPEFSTIIRLNCFGFGVELCCDITLKNLEGN